MSWNCAECKIEIKAIVVPHNAYVPEDVGEPMYRKQEFVNGKRTVVCGYCGPECSLKAYEKCKSKKKKK